MFLIALLWLQRQAVKALDAVKRLAMSMLVSLRSGKSPLHWITGTDWHKRFLTPLALRFLWKARLMVLMVYFMTFGVGLLMVRMVTSLFSFLGSLTHRIVKRSKKALSELQKKMTQQKSLTWTMSSSCSEDVRLLRMAQIYGTRSTLVFPKMPG